MNTVVVVQTPPTIQCDKNLLKWKLICEYIFTQYVISRSLLIISTILKCWNFVSKENRSTQIQLTLLVISGLKFVKLTVFLLTWAFLANALLTTHQILENHPSGITMSYSNVEVQWNSIGRTLTLAHWFSNTFNNISDGTRELSFAPIHICLPHLMPLMNLKLGKTQQTESGRACCVGRWMDGIEDQVTL